MKHRAQNKLKARKRYKRMRSNPAFKRRRRLYRMNPQRFRRLASMLGEFRPIPFWSASMGSGAVVGASSDGDVFYVLVRHPDQVLTIDQQDLLDTVVFLEPEAIDSFFELLDAAMDAPVEASAVSDAMVQLMEDHEI